MEQIPPAAGAAGAAGAAAQGPASTAAAGAAASTQATAGATLPVVTQGPASVDASANEKLIEEARAAARARLLKELGFEKVDDAKGALSKAREIADAQLTEKDRLTKQLEELTPKAKRAEAADAALKEFADQAFSALPEAVQKYITDTVGEDPVARVRAINSARSSGLLTALAPPAAAAGQAAAGQAAASPAAKPATTVAPAGPATPKAPGTLTPYEQLQQLKSSGQTLRAAQFAMQNRRAIEASRPAR